MANISELKSGDSIAHNDPYQGEGEKIVVEPNVPHLPGYALVITTLSKFAGLNGHQIYMDHDVIEEYYHKKA